MPNHLFQFCSYCTDPESFVETTRTFLRSCLKGRRGYFPEGTNEITTVGVRYNPDLVKKVIHVFRNPLDNTVARFHLDRKIMARKNADWLKDYPNNKEGFRRWCIHLNAISADVLSSLRWIDSSLEEAMKNVPCITEFYRYVQWHNLAFAATSDLEVPNFVLHYEDYSSRFEEVTSELITFLELEKVGEAPEFIDNKKYDEYYTPQEKRAISVFIKEFASKPTWRQLKHYLDLNMYPDQKTVVIV